MFDIVVQRVAGFRIDPRVLRRPERCLILISTPAKREYLERTGVDGAFDEIVVIDQDFDGDLLSSTIRKIIKATDARNVVIMCHDEYALLAAAEARIALGIEGARPPQVAPFVDKVAMKRAVEAAGVRVPRYTIFDAARYLAEGDEYLDMFADVVGFPAFVKPTGESGSVGAQKLDSRADLDQWAALTEDRPATGNTVQYEVDEFITGTLYHVDTLIDGGQICYVRVNRYLLPMADYADGHICGSYTLSEEDPIYERLVEFNALVIDAFREKPESGAIHHEVFETKTGELVFLEIAARAPAALIPQTGRIRWGVDIEECHFRLQRGDEVDLNCDFRGAYAGWIFFPKVDGVVADIQRPQVDSSLIWIPNVEVGQSISRCADVRDYAAATIIWNIDYDSLLSDLDKLTSFQPIKTIDELSQII